MAPRIKVEYVFNKLENIQFQNLINIGPVGPGKKYKLINVGPTFIPDFANIKTLS